MPALLGQIPTHALRRLSPTHGICGESYPYQRSADPVGQSGKCSDESVGRGPSVRMLRMPLSAPTKLFPLSTETPEASESV